jgi:hypothetical protein
MSVNPQTLISRLQQRDLHVAQMPLTVKSLGRLDKMKRNMTIVLSGVPRFFYACLDW